MFPLPQVEVIGGTDKYQAVCRKCYGGLVVQKENSAPCKSETPQNTNGGKVVDSAFPRKVLSSLQLWTKKRLAAKVEQWEQIL